jgi:hypothetical protein
MVKVLGFPRPLYPPDANEHGKKPSVDGPDVQAYKRTVSRAGRWEWTKFDDTYSNGFAHGKSGNVGETGIAGVQRQQDIDDTGWLGQKTFNTLRSIRIPKGLPHAGEMAMDATAVALVNAAFARFSGREPAPEGTGTVRVAALKRARTQLGVTESPPDSNRCKYTDWYGMVGPWCAMFVTWSFELGATDVRKQAPSFIRGKQYAYVPYVVGDARAARNGLTTTDDPRPGDLVCYDWQRDGEYDHIGIFEQWEIGTGTFTAIEGNTSVDNNSNGGQVMRRHRDVSRQRTVFVRVAEPMSVS